jgi:hypothetical protein
VANHAFGNASKEGLSQGAEAPAAHDHDSCAELLAEVNDRLGRTAEPEMDLGDSAARSPDPLYLFVE